MKTVIWHDQESETVRQRLRDVDEARGMIWEVGSGGILICTFIHIVNLYITSQGEKLKRNLE